MGLLSSLWPSKSQLDLATQPIRSPWASTQLTKIVLNDIAGVMNADVSRAQAMKVPAVARGRALIAGTLSRYPLALFDYATGSKLETPLWMTSTKTNQAPSTRMLWTFDDILFSGMSVWAVERDNNDAITDAIRVNPANWSIDPDSLGVLINGKPTSNEEVLIFEGPQEGLLVMANEAIRASRDMANAWQQRVASPIPLIEIHQIDPDAELEENEVDETIQGWELARKRGGATAYTPAKFEIRTHGEIKTDLFIEGRNAERLDWGNFLSLPAAMLDGSMSTATLTYSTVEGKRSEFVDYSLSYWAQSIEARLSQDDVTPDGTYTRFDLSWLTSPTQQGSNPPSED